MPLLLAGAIVHEEGWSMKLTLLGTGTPIPDPARRGPSQVIDVGGGLVLIDAGSGVVQRLVEAGYADLSDGRLRPPIARIALTHLHSDHVLGLADLLWSGWVMRWWDEPPPIAGPPGTAALVEGLLSAFAYDIGVRTRGERLRRDWLAPRVEEIDEGWRCEGDGWRLHGFRVEHEPVDQAFGYRIDGDGGAFVVSGDTRPSENLIRQAQGADLLVHEVYWRTGALRLRERAAGADELARRLTIERYHTSSEELGRVAADADVRALVLSHILFRGGAPADLERDIAETYRGAVTTGADLMAFAVGRR
jgi:ribonuclease Z